MSERIKRLDLRTVITTITHEHTLRICHVPGREASLGHRLAHIVGSRTRVVLCLCLDADRKTSAWRNLTGDHTRNGKTSFLTRVPAHDYGGNLVMPTAHINCSTAIYNNDDIVIETACVFDHVVLSLRKSESPVVVLLLRMPVKAD